MSPLRARLLPTSLVLLLCTCTDDSDTNADDCRADLVGDWESVNEFACPAVDPTCTYHHMLNFDGSNYTWVPDQEFAGTYTCTAGMVEAVEAGEVVFTASYDPTTDMLELTWDGLTAPEPYQRVSP
jgi:hypothetical protein